MIGRHLRQPGGRRAFVRLLAQIRVVGDDVSRLDERGVLAAIGAQCLVVGMRHQRMPELREFVDIELVVRIQHVILEVGRRRSRVVLEPMQREVDPRRREERERIGLAGRRLVRSVHDPIVELGEIGRIEHVAHRHQPFAAQIALQMNALGKGEVNRNRMLRHADFDRHMMVLRQQPQLLAVVVAEKIGARHRRFIDTGARHEAIGTARIHARIDFRLQPHERIAGAHMLAERLVAPIPRKRIA